MGLTTQALAVRLEYRADGTSVMRSEDPTASRPYIYRIAEFDRLRCGNLGRRVAREELLTSKVPLQ